ncbi:hypothetical protein [Novosphingobium guangzhouense]|uniref:Uncharacterized protein n=1 Tax=Novosphingobium guangzhouense TaxID=1850347 RepID=A0A2K2FZM0_9SPHN|nr:hypothetical protein [Novosphingobium guangzhouense]PNU04198.1 hypothetical protein A8V01_21360 [Novosphingobium guangzhouense]
MASTSNTYGMDRARARQLRDFLHDCAGSAPCEEIDRIREALALLGGSGIDGNAPLDRSRVDAMLDCGAAMSAVLEIMGPDIPFMLSRGSHDTCLATVVPPGGSEEAIAEGTTLALAMLAGHVAAVLARGEHAVAHVADPQIGPASIRLH